MIQIYIADEKDYILDYQDFKDHHVEDIINYIKTGLENRRVQIIKIRKWESK